MSFSVFYCSVLNFVTQSWNLSTIWIWLHSVGFIAAWIVNTALPYKNCECFIDNFNCSILNSLHVAEPDRQRQTARARRLREKSVCSPPPIAVQNVPFPQSNDSHPKTESLPWSIFWTTETKDQFQLNLYGKPYIFTKVITRAVRRNGDHAGS